MSHAQEASAEKLGRRVNDVARALQGLDLVDAVSVLGVVVSMLLRKVPTEARSDVVAKFSEILADQTESDK